MKCKAPDQVAYVGDDVVDLPVMRKVGLAIAVQDAHPRWRNSPLANPQRRRLRCRA